MAILFCILAAAFIGGALCIVRYRPPKSSARPINIAIAIASVALLIYLSTPWAEIAFDRFSNAEKDTLARKHFDPAYGLARRSIENCRQFNNTIGELQSLDISHRRSFVREKSDRTHGFFDFDYVGSDNAGRLTVGISFRESTENGPPPSYEVVSQYGDEALRAVRLLVYAKGKSQHYEVMCPWFNKGD